jgi:hypothetical protein
MEDKKLRLKQLAEEILAIVNEGDVESPEHEAKEEEGQEEAGLPRKEMAKASLVAKLKKKMPQEMME